MPSTALRLLVQSLEALGLVLPLSTVCWATDRDLWIVAAAGAPLALFGRIVNRHLSQVVESEDPDHPSLAGHRRALGGELAHYQITLKGRAWRVSVTPAALGGKVIGCVGTALLLPAALPPTAPIVDPEISVISVPDLAWGERPGDYVWERPGQPALLQRVLPESERQRLHAEGRLVPYPSPVTPPARAVPVRESAAGAAAAPRRPRGGRPAGR